MFFIIIFFYFLINMFQCNAIENFKAPNAIILNYNNLEIIYKTNNIYKKSIPSSMTKVMTAYIIFDLIDKNLLKLDNKYKISIRAWRQEGSRMFLEPEKYVEIDSLLKGLIVQSGNDAAVALAEGSFENIENFVNEMNKTAKLINMNNTHFANPNGLYDSNHYMSTYDTALLFYNLIKNHKTLYDKYFNLPSFSYNNISQRNRNFLLGNYNGLDGGKTGHTDEGGYSLVSSVERNGQRFIVVVNGLQNENDRFIETKKMFDYAFSLFSYINLYKKDEIIQSINVSNGDKKFLNIYTPVDIIYSTKKENINKLKVELIINNNLKAPIKKDEVVGNIIVHDINSTTKFDLLAKENINKLKIYDKFVLFLYNIYKNIK